MKTLKKIGSFALAVLLVFALSASALADDSTDALSKAVTITNLAAGEKVTAYKLVSYTDGFSGYTTDASFGAYLNGLTEANAKDPAKWASGSVDITRLLEGYVAACSAGTRSLPAVYGEQTAAGTDVSFTLAPGYYMMLVSTTMESGKVYRPLSVFVKVTGETSAVYGGGQNQALTKFDSLTAKGEAAPVLDKMVRAADSDWSKTDDAGVGDTVSFYLKVTIPYYTDVSDVALSVEDALADLVYNSDARLYDAVPDSADAHEITDAMTTENNGGKLTFTLDYGKLMTAGTTRIVYIGYTASVAASAAALGERHSASGTAKLLYGNAAMPGELLQTASVTTIVYNYSFGLTKYYVDANDYLQPLAGAEFTFYSDSSCQNALSFVKDGGVYRPALAGETGVTAIPTDLTLCGLDAGTYYTKETKTPKGYAPPEGAYKVVLNPSTESDKIGQLDHTHDSYVPVDPSRMVSVSASAADDALVHMTRFPNEHYERMVISFLNTTLPTLPSTGGIGTAVFTAGGVAVMALAVALLLCRKKKEN